jgi:hypothetical protein
MHHMARVYIRMYEFTLNAFYCLFVCLYVIKPIDDCSYNTLYDTTRANAALIVGVPFEDVSPPPRAWMLNYFPFSKYTGVTTWFEAHRAGCNLP